MAFSSPEKARSVARAFAASASASPGNPFLTHRQPTMGAAKEGAAEGAAADREGGDNAVTRFDLEVSSRTDHRPLRRHRTAPTALPPVEDPTIAKLGAA